MTNTPSPLTELYVIGPSSTGKTTLCNAIAQSLELPSWCYITEAARQVINERGFARADIDKIEMQSAIMFAQMEKEGEVRKRALRNVGEALILSDRSGVDPVVYAVLTATDECQAQQRKNILVKNPTFQNTLEQYRKAAKFLLLKPVPEWRVDDGVRNLFQQEYSLHVYRAILAEFGLSYQEMGEETKGLTDRVNWVERWLSAGPSFS